MTFNAITELEGNEQIQQVVDGIFSTLFVYSDRTSELAVESLLHKLFTKQPPNLNLIKYFLTLFKRQVNSLSKSTQSPHVHPRIVLLRWTFILVADSLDVLAQDSAMLTLLMSSQSSLLSSVALAPAKFRASTFLGFSHVFQKASWLLMKTTITYYSGV